MQSSQKMHEGQNKEERASKQVGKTNTVVSSAPMLRDLLLFASFQSRILVSYNLHCHPFSIVVCVLHFHFSPSVRACVCVFIVYFIAMRRSLFVLPSPFVTANASSSDECAAAACSM